MQKGINVQQTFFWRWIITLVVVIVSWLVRANVMPSMPVQVHLFASVILVVVIQCVWYLLLLVHHLLNRWLPLERFQYGRIVLQLVIGVGLVICVRYLVFLVVYDFREIPKKHEVNGMIYLANTLISVSINLVFISDEFIKRWRQSFERAAVLEQEKLHMQYHHLKNQVDPQFLSHTISSLDNLVTSDPGLASQFIGHLAKVYRYVLQHDENIVVKIGQEITFIEHYRTLMQDRFGDAIQIEVDVASPVLQKGVVMVTLQMLIDNAIKHNIMTVEQPLKIQIYNDEDHLIISNNKQAPMLRASSEKKGLSQLQHLYKILSGKDLQVKDEQETFKVVLPML
ncbi:histidine kinase [Chitinophaga skermanii]|uniref:Histidine kinase n=1 Tax=Chitinophaga skermanii TaxID=331697 RepID=A0A327QQX3_9BACT|nr:histidine kinase [Chitinophaga skermanii]RAJ06730.1 histidine kinase [Chitinophaga skermanii]